MADALAHMEAIRSFANDSIYSFGEKVLGYDAFHPDLHREVISRFLMEWDDAKPIKLMLVPRRHLKSTFGSEILPSWLWTQTDPDRWNFPCGRDTRIFLAHGKRDMAVDYLKVTKSHHSGNDMLRMCWPDVIWENPRSKHSRMKQAPHWAEAPRWEADALDVLRTRYDKSPSFHAGGTNSPTVGFHYHWLILDDLVFEENVTTPEQRHKTLQYFQQLYGAQLLHGGRCLILGTRWHHDDFYGKLLDPQGEYADVVDSLVLDCGFERGEPIYPINERVPSCGFDMATLEHKLKTMGHKQFYAQYMNEPTLATEQSFRKEDIQRYRPTLDHQFPGAEDRVFQFVTSIDPNHSMNSNNDPGVVITVAMDDQGDVWVVEITRGHPTIRGLIEWTMEHVARWMPEKVVVEVQGYQQQLEPEFKRAMQEQSRFFNLVTEHRGPRQSKHARILKMQPMVERGALHVPYGPLGDALVDELVHLGTWKNDDIADALCDAFTHAKAPCSSLRGSEPELTMNSGGMLMQEAAMRDSMSRSRSHRRM